MQLSSIFTTLLSVALVVSAAPVVSSIPLRFSLHRYSDEFFVFQPSPNAQPAAVAEALESRDRVSMRFDTCLYHNANIFSTVAQLEA